MDILSIDIWPLAVWRCVKSKDRRGDKSSWKCFNLSEPLFLIVRWFRLQSQILFSALDIWSTAAKCAVLRSFALLFPSELTQFTSHSAIREINNILTLHCCIYSPLPAGTWFLMKNFPETERNGCSLLTHRQLCVLCPCPLSHKSSSRISMRWPPQKIEC